MNEHSNRQARKTTDDRQATERLVVDASAAPLRVLEGHLHLGTTRSPDGHEISANSRSLLRDGKPWLPVSGEIHYARYPEEEWRDELLKIKAGGIDIVALYVFWIHHEEEEGRFDWSGRRNLRRFVELCHDLDLYVAARIGPWCHGECRNGGLPDWLLKKGLAVRTNDPGYLHYVRRLYTEIASQLRGLLWKDGGPVISVQYENEYSGPAEHLLTLKRISREVGLDVPLNTRTGWPELSTPMPLGELLPLYGSYADGFWDRTIEEMPTLYRRVFLFLPVRMDTAIGADQLGSREAKDDVDTASYPYLACEIGGGMERSYHRRIRIAPKDIESSASVKVGSGNNLQGYYMYHGGTNPEGRLSTLQESQATGYPNDLPVKSYDFQAPLGEFGQVREHYHLLRRMHLFLRHFGSLLATMPMVLPQKQPTNADDTTTLRWAVRTDGHGGFVFVNNYQRLQPMPAKDDIQFELRLVNGSLSVPFEPINVPADSAFFWPFNLDLGGATLVYATAQPICRLDEQDTRYIVFGQTAGIPAEFVFEGVGVTVESSTGTMTAADGHIRIEHVTPGIGPAIHLRTDDGQRLSIVLLDEEQSLACWKGTLLGRERLFLTRASLTLDGDTLRLHATGPTDLTVAIFPHPMAGSAEQDNNLFRRFTMPGKMAERINIAWEQIQAAGPARQVLIGSGGVAEAPSDAEFDYATVWRIDLPSSIDANRDLRLRIRYAGDVARLYLDGRLLMDNFYNGDAFEVGLKRYAPDVYSKELLLKILPLRVDAPIYLPGDAWPDFGDAESVVLLAGIDVIEELESVWTPG